MTRNVDSGAAIAASAAELGLTLTPREQTLLERYLALVEEWRPRVRLTGVAAPQTAGVLVTAAFCLLPFVQEAGRLADLGSGAGAPGVPLAILRPRLRVALADAAARKAAFLEVVARELRLSNVEIVHARAETLGRDPAHRGQYDVVTAQALAPVRVLAEYALPLLRIGGVAVLPKGRAADQEVRDAAQALALLGGAAAVLPARSRSCSPAVLVRKTARTPSEYPRRPGVPSRRPL